VQLDDRPISNIIGTYFHREPISQNAVRANPEGKLKHVRGKGIIHATFEIRLNCFTS